MIVIIYCNWRPGERDYKFVMFIMQSCFKTDFQVKYSWTVHTEEWNASAYVRG